MSLRKYAMITLNISACSKHCNIHEAELLMQVLRLEEPWYCKRLKHLNIHLLKRAEYLIQAR